MNDYGYQLLGAGKTQEAIAVFKQNAEKYPASWNTYDSLGEGLAAAGPEGGSHGAISEGPLDGEGRDQPEAD